MVRDAGVKIHCHDYIKAYIVREDSLLQSNIVHICVLIVCLTQTCGLLPTIALTTQMQISASVVLQKI